VDPDDLPTILDDPGQHMVLSYLGDLHSLLLPKAYFDLHMQAFDDMPNLEECF
jgi:hypothetical protein